MVKGSSKVSFFILLGLVISLTIQGLAYAESLEDIDIEILNVKKFESANSDVLMFKLSFVNNGNVAADIPLIRLYLVDSESREFTSYGYFSLREKGHQVSQANCPITFSVEINPGLSATEKLCFKVPKDIGQSISLKLYENDPSICASPNYQCDIMTIPYTIKSVTEHATMTTEMQQKSSIGGGCLIATAAYGSELAPQVQQLREIRDNSLLQTESGSAFMESFNSFYYSFSPEIADLERENPVFKEVVKLTITPLLSSLSLLNYVDMDSESEVLGYGIGIILMNIGMYFIAPVIVILKFVNITSKTSNKEGT